MLIRNRRDRFVPFFEYMNLYMKRVADLYALPDNSALNNEESLLVKEVTEYMSAQTDIFKTKEYIQGMLKLGGFPYLTIVKEHITNNVLPTLQSLRRSCAGLEKDQPGRWREHRKVIEAECGNFIINRGVLQRELKAYEETEQCVAAPRMR